MKIQKQYNQTKRSALIFSTFLLAGLIQACGQSSGGGGGSSDPSSNVGDSGTPICSASLDQTSFFEDAPQAQASVESDDGEALRVRHVTAQADRLREAIQHNTTGVLTLSLFDDKEFQVEIESARTFADRGVAMTGHLQDHPLSDVTVVVNNDVVAIRVNEAMTQSHYDVSYEGDGIHKIQMMAEDHEGHEDCEAFLSPEIRPPAEEGDQAAAALGAPVIDMLVAYTPAARSAVGGKDAMIALIQMGIADTNKSFAQSGVNLAARVVGTMEVTQNDSNNFTSDLSAIKGTNDGKWDQVHAERARLGADQVTIVGVYSGNSVAGIGYISSTASTAFSVVKYSAFKTYSFTHELGHNVGLNHSDGYVNSSGSFRTVMAYGTVPRIARFSNPSLDFNGYKTGTSSQNSTKILNAEGSAMAALVVAKVPATQDPPVPPPVTQKPPVGTTPSEPCN